MTADFKKKKGAISPLEDGPKEPQYKVYTERLVINGAASWHLLNMPQSPHHPTTILLQ